MTEMAAVREETSRQRAVSHIGPAGANVQKGTVSDSSPHNRMIILNFILMIICHDFNFPMVGL